jgi:hypothetical protein
VSDLNAALATNTLPAAEYTMLLPPDTNSLPPTNSPGGDSYALITNHAGTARITGSLADGTALAQTVPVSEGGYVPVYANLYSGKGLLLGWINLESIATNGVGLTWIHPGTHSGLYTNGFTNVLMTNQIQLSQWTKPQNFDALTNLMFLDTINGDGLLPGIGISVTNSGKLKGTAVSGSVTPATGLVTLTYGAEASKVTAHGAMLDVTNGGGFFLTKTNAEAIQLGP